MAFNIFTTKRVFRFGQYHGINDLITCNLRGDKCTGHQQFLARKFHHSAVCKCFDPLVWHLAPIRGEAGVYRKYTLPGAKTCRQKDKFAWSITVTFRVSRPLGVPSPCRPCERNMPILPHETPIERICWKVLGRKTCDPSATYGKS
jgi:hypothetical protein